MDDGTARLALLSGVSLEEAWAVRVSSSLPGSDRPRRPGLDPPPGVYWWWEAPRPQATADDAGEMRERLRSLGYAH